MERMRAEMNTQSNFSEPLKNECPYCHDTGYEYIKETNSCRECRCGILQKQIMSNKLQFASIPERFKDAKIKNFDTGIYKNTNNKKMSEMACKCVRQWLKDFDEMKERGLGLYLYSKTKGSGKSRMAATIANELIATMGIQVKFATSLQILSEIKSTWNKDSEQDESKLLYDLSKVPVLVIDDFGTENQESAWINDRFYNIINSRYVEKKITIFTSNERLDNLKYDSRIVNRMMENTIAIPFPEESIRNSIAKDNLQELIERIRDE